MAYTIEIKNSKVPTLYRKMDLPDRIGEAILNDDSYVGMQIAKAIFGDYENHPDGGNKFYRIMDGNKLLIDFGDSNRAMQEIIGDMMAIGIWEPYTTQIVKREVKKGDITVDVGASIGYFSLLMARLVGKEGKVYAIEPTANQAPYLQDNIAANGYQDIIEFHNVAAWDTNDLIKPRVNAGHRGVIQGRILDEILPEKVDFIKIDVDGSEPRVVKGLLKTIERNTSLKMVIEYYPAYMNALGNSEFELMELLEKYFICEKITRDFKGEEYYNLFCVRNGNHATQ